MQQGSNPRPTRRPRGDGERNRARLIAAAKRAFAEGGPAVSLEPIAREAGVSIATLYRHFQTRDALISAVYQQEVDTLIETADRLLTEREPATALRKWLMLFVEFLGAKHGIAEAMTTLIGGPEALYSKTRDRLTWPITALVAGAVATGGFRTDIQPLDLLRALTGIARVRPDEDWKQSAVRMVDLLLRGMQSTA